MLTNPFRSLRLGRPSPAMVVALIALLVALGSGAYAAVNLPANSVGTKQIKRGAVNSNKVKDHSLLAKDFRRGQLPAGPRGPQGIHGPKGDKGDTGAPGTAGTNGLNGHSVLSGSGAPAASLGDLGDLYINTANYTLYGPKTAATGWDDGASLVGPKGDPGPSDAYVTNSIMFTNPKTISVTVPPGYYVVNAKADAYNPTAGTLTNPQCTVPGETGFGGSVPPAGETTIALQTSLNMTSGGVIQLSCNTPSFTFGYMRLAAIKVGALH